MNQDTLNLLIQDTTWVAWRRSPEYTPERELEEKGGIKAEDVHSTGEVKASCRTPGQATLMTRDNLRAIVPVVGGWSWSRHAERRAGRGAGGAVDASAAAWGAVQRDADADRQQRVRLQSAASLERGSRANLDTILFTSRHATRRHVTRH